MQIFSKDKIYNFMKFSPAFLAILIISICVVFGYKKLSNSSYFSSETLVQVSYDKNAPVEQIREKMSNIEYFRSVNGVKNRAIMHFLYSSNILFNDINSKIQQQLKGTGEFQIVSINVVGPKIGSSLRNVITVFLAIYLFGVVLFMGYAIFNPKTRFGIKRV